MTLAAHDLCVGRGGVPVLSGLSFNLAPGRALILRGPNGAGKTTLLRTLAGLQPPLRGRVLPGPGAVAFGGHRDGMKGQLSVVENLAFWARIHGRTGIDIGIGIGIAAALDAFALAAVADRPAQQLSAGQIRRLGLARMLLTGRPVWCLDEPTVSLDAESTARFAGVVERHLATGGGAVIATHIGLDLAGAELDLRRWRARPEDAVAKERFA